LGFIVKNYKYKKCTYSLWDVPGQIETRNTWRHYYLGTKVVLFVIDVSDGGRFDDARKELERVCKDQQLVDVPFLILGNKSDVENGANQQELEKAFNFSSLNIKSPFKIQMCSAKTGEGINESLEWINNLNFS
jgi:small GTP-binding protein